MCATKAKTKQYSIKIYMQCPPISKYRIIVTLKIVFASLHTDLVFHLQLSPYFRDTL